jgi:hypothetical protein
VAVQFRLKNTGTSAYDDSPSNGVTVIDKDGQRFSESFSMGSGLSDDVGEWQVP